ncbi:MAG: hypothetical protein GXP09_02325 [Gammaproteobacteria bacterium]|nr:hypothetical protein [Gammaproteobacteria bacterium]
MIAIKRWIGASLVSLALALPAAASPRALTTGGSVWIGGGGHYGFSLTPPHQQYNYSYSHYDYPSYYYGYRGYDHGNYGYRGQYGHGVRQHGYGRYGQRHRYRARH